MLLKKSNCYSNLGSIGISTVYNFNKQKHINWVLLNMDCLSRIFLQLINTVKKATCRDSKFLKKYRMQDVCMLMKISP